MYIYFLSSCSRALTAAQMALNWLANGAEIFFEA